MINNVVSCSFDCFYPCTNYDNVHAGTQFGGEDLNDNCTVKLLTLISFTIKVTPTFNLSTRATKLINWCMDKRNETKTKQTNKH